MFQKESYEQVIRILGKETGAEAYAGIDFYIRALTAWNQRVNLVSKKSAGDMWSEHIVPSLVYVLHMDRRLKYIDVGTGAGLPGLVLKIVYPDLQIDLLDSNRKKILFCKFIANELKIEDMDIILDRVENRMPIYDGALFRAVSDVEQLQKMASYVLKPGGQLLSIKGRDEIQLSKYGHAGTIREIPEQIKIQSLRLLESVLFEGHTEL